MQRHEMPTLYGFVSNSQQLQRELVAAYNRLLIRRNSTTQAGTAGYVTSQKLWTGFCDELTALGTKLAPTVVAPPVAGKQSAPAKAPARVAAPDADKAVA